MLKGSAEIIMYDENGNEVGNVVSDNIVTNAVQNIISGALDRMVGSIHNAGSNANVDLSKLFTLYDSVVKDLFGGIMLFSEPITEDVEHCIPSSKEIKSLLAYASIYDTPLAESKTKGSFNAEESIFSDEMCKLVFDFGGGIGTGTVKALCLSSALGNKYGLKNNTVQGEVLPTQLVSLYPSKIFDPTTIHTFAQPHAPLVQTSAVYTAMYYYNDMMYYISSSKLYKISAKSAFKNGIGLLNNFDTGKTSGNEPTQVAISASYSKILPSFSLQEIWGYQTKSTKASLVLSKLTGDGVETEVTINLSALNASLEEFLGKTFTANPFNTYAPGCMVKDNEIYFMVGDVNYSDQTVRPTKLRIYSIDFSGNVRYNDCSSEAVLKLFAGKASGSTTALYDISTRFLSLNDSLFVCYSGVATGGKCTCLMVDTENVKLLDEITLSSANNVAYTSYCTRLAELPTLKSPWVSAYNGGASSRKTAFTVELFMCYIATINNISEPIVKGETNSLRVIYTLTQT